MKKKNKNLFVIKAKGPKSKNDKENINLYEEYYERLLYEIQNFKNNYYKKESNKIIKTLYFSKICLKIQYLSHCFWK